IAAADEVSFLDRLDRLHRREAGVPGTDTHEPDSAARTHDEEVRAFGIPRNRSAPTASAPLRHRRWGQARAARQTPASVLFRWPVGGLDSSARGSPPALLPQRSARAPRAKPTIRDRKSTRLSSSHGSISYAV